jgi:hypothetical protein
LRLPNHLGIWKTTEYFLQGSALGAFFTLILLPLSVFSKRFLSDHFLRFRPWLIIIFSINLLFVMIAAIDHFVYDNAGNFGLMYYPFRTSAFGFFIALITVVDFGFKKLELIQKQVIIKRVLLWIISGLFVVQTINNIKRSNTYFQADPAFKAMCEFVKNQTPKSAVFVLPQPYFASEMYISFGRRAERENFFVPKFVSAERGKLLEWYLRHEDYLQLRAKPMKVFELGPKYNLSHLITTQVHPEETFELLYKSGEYLLYRINY